MKARHLLFCFMFISFLFACSKENTSGTTEDNGDNQPSGNENSEQTIPENDVIYPAGLEELTEKIKLAATGVPVDFDEDGFAEFQRTFFEDGGELVEMFTPDGAVYYQAEYNADGSHIIYQDINRDGMTDIQETLSIDPIGEERLYDRDFDGYPEERVRVEFDETNHSITVIYERDDEGFGNYIVTSEETIVLNTDDQSMTKKYAQRKKDDSVYYGPVEISWRTCGIKEGDNNSIKQAYQNGLKIAAAAECALNHGRNCLKEINRGWFEKITGWLERNKTVKVDCSMIEPEKPRVAWADTYDYALLRDMMEVVKFFNGYAEIHFKTTELNGLLGCASTDTACISQNNDDKLCNIFLHELMHHVEGVTPPPEHNNGIDAIYSCGRYCGGCAQNLFGATGDPHADCLRCAGIFDEKLACGYVEEIREEACKGSLGVCHAGLGCIYGNCGKCKTFYRNTCDEEILGEEPFVAERESFLCCAQCPSDCDSSNDFPCEASYLTENTCHDPLPMCTREH